jgi:hypothetical protein
MEKAFTKLFITFMLGFTMWTVVSILIVYSKIKFQQYINKEKHERVKQQHEMRKGGKVNQYYSKGDVKRKTKPSKNSIQSIQGQDKYYELARIAFNSAMKNGQMKRDEIVGLSKLLDNMLELSNKKYDTYYFKNDCHKIYVQLKDGNLGQLEYQKIIDYISNSKGVNDSSVVN